MTDDRGRASTDLALSRSEGERMLPPAAAVPLSTFEALEDLLQPRGPSVKDFVKLLQKRRRIILGTALVVFLLGCLYSAITPDQYTAISTLEIRGYAPVLGEAALESMLELDTRKILYQTTTMAKLSHLGLVDEVLSTNNLGEDVKKYFRKTRSLYGRVKAFVKKRIFGVAIDETQLDLDDPRFQHRQTFLANYLKLIQISPVHETSLVQVRVTTTDRRLSQKIANAHAEGLIRHLNDERRTELSAHLDTLRVHAEELKKKLADAERDVAAYAEEHQLVSLAGDADGSLMSSHLGELNKLLSQAQARRFESESKAKAVGKTKFTESALLDDETVKDLRTKLKDAESEYAALSQLVTSEYPKLVELRGKIDSLQGTIRRERQGNLEALKTQYQSDLASEKLLVEQFEEQLNKAHRMSTQLVQFNLLQREAGSLRDLTQSVLKALKETQISAASSKSNVFVSDYAPLPRVPSAPRRNIIIVFSIVLGLVAGIGLAVLREVIDSTIKVSDDAQAALGIPTLGIIPSFEKLDRFEPEVKNKLWHTVVKLLPFSRETESGPGAQAGSASSGDETSEDRDSATDEAETDAEHGQSDSEVTSVVETTTDLSSPAAASNLRVVATTGPGSIPIPEAAVLDALRTLRANILFSSTQNTSRVIMVTSSREREGKTSVVTNLAVTFSRASQRTLLIDGDLRRPKVGRRFSLSPDRRGLVDYLAEQAGLDDVIVPTEVANLFVIPAGSPTVNPTELLGSRRMSDLVANLREHFDVILLDATPVLPVADALILAQCAETVIMVVRSGKTEKAVAQETLRRLRRVGARVRGVVLNDFDAGEGSYSSDRYSVSQYTVVMPEKVLSDEAGIDRSAQEEERTAVGS